MDLSQSQYIQTIESDGQKLYKVIHPKFNAEISSFGAQLVSFVPDKQDDLLWLSKSAVKDSSKAIRGGVPICWPWFGPAPIAFAGEPQHGYLRNLYWSVNKFEETEQNVTIELELDKPEQIKNNFGLDAKIRFILSDSAEVQIVTTNVSDKIFELSQAIHTYFNVLDITKTSISSLVGSKYIDKLSNSKICYQTSDLTVDSAMDRIYLYDKPQLEIETQQRVISIKGKGHDSVIVWNPWQESAKSMPDFDDNGYQQMLCVEMGLTQGYELRIGEPYVLSQTFIIT